MASAGIQKNRAPTEAKVRRLAVATFTHGDVRAACRVEGVAERTGYRWSTTDVFRSALREAQIAAMETATRALAAGATEAVALLRAIIADRDAPESVRCRAAIAVLDGALKMAGYLDIETRLATLEASVCERSKPGSNSWNA